VTTPFGLWLPNGDASFVFCPVRPHPLQPQAFTPVSPATRADTRATRSTRRRPPPAERTKRLGPLLARRRNSLGLSQLRVAEQLCDASGVPTVTRHEVSRWEREKRLPSLFWLRCLGLVLRLPLNELELAAAVSRTRRSRQAN
jgi:hypothetical protein